MSKPFAKVCFKCKRLVPVGDKKCPYCCGQLKEVSTYEPNIETIQS
jgi:RNA polymerase subunit RPABC4/transcription elongation factor Spt4